MTDQAPIQQEPDVVPGLRLLRLAGLAIAVSLVGGLGSWWMLRRDPASRPPARTVSSAAFAPGTPEQTPIDTTERGIALKLAQKKQLSRYGWVNRSVGIARIPIERAIELRAEGVR